ncbi:MAG: hypothetical protein PGN24_09795 [Microbacterium arborescens]
MSSELPDTAVPLGISDPVQKARAELKAALAAIEHKANLPKRAVVATDRAARDARAYARTNPAGATAAAVGVAVAVGAAVWGIARLLSR